MHEALSQVGKSSAKCSPRNASYECSKGAKDGKGQDYHQPVAEANWWSSKCRDICYSHQ